MDYWVVCFVDGNDEASFVARATADKLVWLNEAEVKASPNRVKTFKSQKTASNFIRYIYPDLYELNCYPIRLEKVLQ